MTYTLTEWAVESVGPVDAYTAPEQIEFILTGRREDGKWVSTSEIVGFSSATMVVRTRSGNFYKLTGPARTIP